MIQLDLPQMILGLFLALLAMLSILVLANSAEPIRRALAAIVGLLIIPAELARPLAQRAVGWLERQTRAVFDRAVHTPEGSWRGWPVIGAFFFASLVLSNLYAETWLLVLSLPLFGFSFGAPTATPEAASLAALAIICLGLYYGGTLTDAVGVTKIGVWHDRPLPQRAVVIVISVLGIVGVLWLFLNIGVLRALHQTVPAEYSVAALEQIDPYAVGSLDADSEYGALLEEPLDDSTTAIAQRERQLILFSNVLLAVLGALVVITGKWAVMWALAYTTGFALGILWLVAAIVDYVLAVTVGMLVALRDTLVPDLTELAHEFVAALRDALDKLRESLFERGNAVARDAAAQHARDFGEQLHFDDLYSNGDDSAPDARSARFA